jgi:hypothetical protein
MTPLRDRGLWVRLFLFGVGSLAIVEAVAWFYFGYAPSWLDWWAGASMVVIVVGFFGWLVTHSLRRGSGPPSSN